MLIKKIGRAKELLNYRSHHRPHPPTPPGPRPINGGFLEFFLNGSNILRDLFRVGK
jgi:hypothetical protein